MIQREFLGWDRPFLDAALDWLLERRAELPRMWVVTPTAQSARRMREALAGRTGACLAPRFTTPGRLLQPAAGGVAARAVEIAAWVAAFEQVDDWPAISDAFPAPPERGALPAWALAAARSMSRLWRTLEENALTIAAVVRKMQDGPDAARWETLADLEARANRRLHEWGLRSRNAALAEGLALPPAAASKGVLAGVPDAPRAVFRMLDRWSGAVHALVGAPESEAVAFDGFGRPVAGAWNERELPWPGDAQVEVAADPRDQAQAALRRVAAAGITAADLALGTADPEVAGELVRAFTDAGWTAFDPSRRLPAPAARWWSAWRAWLAAPEAGSALDLLAMPATAALVGGRRAQKAAALAAARDFFLVVDREDLARALPLAREVQRAGFEEAIEALDALGRARAEFLADGPVDGIGRLSARIARHDPEAARFVDEWLDAVADAAARTPHNAGFWLELLLDEWPPQPGEVPDLRVLDVGGWLELFHHPGAHLVVCGMNDGMVPAAGGGDPWLGESQRVGLGLGCEAGRAARDAYLFTAMCEARRAGGRVNVVLGKAGAGGDPLRPSRLLLAPPAAELPGRVIHLFAGIEPPDAGLAWQADWLWQPRGAEPSRRINVTALRDYLACPFRFYLKHVLGMGPADPERGEWSPREFGTIAHAVLEAWGRDPEAREMSKQEALEEWLLAKLDRMVTERCGDQPPVAVEIQLESLRQRLRWFARVQACERAAGWRVAEVERKFELEIDGFTIVGKIDRIDVDAAGRRRVLDYKTKAKVEEVQTDHRKSVGARTRWPEHVEGVPAACCTGVRKGKLVEMRWHNLQAPLYAAAVDGVAELGYFGLGATEAEVRLALWEGFDDADRESALECARWIIGRIAAGVFWPPAANVRYDDHEPLAAGKTLDRTVAPPGNGGAG